MRSEYKYLVPERLLPRLRDDIAPFVALDPHCEEFEGRGYTVRSLYLDTPTLRYYHEKKAGIRVRRKLRIRAYNEWQFGSWVFLEIKRKVDDKIAKNRAPTLVENVEPLLRTGDVERFVLQNDHYPGAIEDARRFLYHVYRYGLGPTFTTVYEREAFLGLADGTFRITFDRNMRGRAFSSPSEIYSEQGLRYVHPGYFIVEIKFNTRLPAWMRTVLGKHNLRHQALSKYCLCGETAGRHEDSKGRVLSSMHITA